MVFKDHFATVAGHYALNRPVYPPSLFDWLAGQCAMRDLAWDCGAGNGQASVELGRLFKRVMATDPSEAQIAQAVAHPRVEYSVASAENSGLGRHSVDLIVVAQALHWFELDPFYQEAKRILRQTGVIAAWSYGTLEVEGSTVNTLVQRFYHDEVGPFWLPERRHVENGYRELPFPFHPVATPPFAMRVHWSLTQLLGYFRSWSATSRFMKVKGYDPVDLLESPLRSCWGQTELPRMVTWPLSILVGRPDQT
ncbi:MAG: class I SAM-dependent methyltransferase [Magnetococcales bacterium]|nr:class I SAM-dependent methyltransferase [Magnetococcales bacterium]